MGAAEARQLEVAQLLREAGADEIINKYTYKICCLIEIIIVNYKNKKMEGRADEDGATAEVAQLLREAVWGRNLLSSAASHF